MNDNSFSRRDFLGLKAASPTATHNNPDLESDPKMVSSVAEFTLQGGLDPYTGLWGREQAAHLLRRTTFGCTYQQIDQLYYLGNVQKAVDYVLNVPKGEPEPPINNYNNDDFKDPDVPFGKTWVNARRNNKGEFSRISSWRGWWMTRMIKSGANIQEKLILFWHNHFSTRTEKSFSGQASYRHYMTLHKHSLGNFKQFVYDVTLDPQMLYFLNGLLNGVDAPDENYARELQELFTIGKDNPNHYTEDDVVAAAKVLTGWRVDYDTNRVYLDLAAHDQSDKQFSKFYNNTVIKGGLEAERELKELIEMIFQKEEVALHICRKLYRFFVYYQIDEVVEANIIKPLAALLRENNYQILPVISKLFKSEHFFDATTRACYIKTPLDLVFGVLRNFNVPVFGPKLYDQYQMMNYLGWTCNDLQMMPGDPPNVAGWAAFRQTPKYYRTWINSDTLRNRNVFSDVMTYWRYETDSGFMASIDHIAFAQQFPRPDDPTLLIDAILQITMPMPISAVKKKALKNILLSGQAQDYYWTIAWRNYIANPNDKAARDTVWFRLAALHKYLMGLPEFQLI
ncbi:DUF1800 domain-containing protein [Haliscomenobacter sp.]|uniref:DUF1800 domain-containing protein n=1 Tax=Haliscomenobacter sp. TaxID=2717303 RepID=UPI003364ED4F